MLLAILLLQANAPFGSDRLVDELGAGRPHAGVERETTDAGEAYARFPRGELTRYRKGRLPE